MNECKRPIHIGIGPNTTPDRVTCDRPEGHSGPHIGTLIDGRRYEWTLPRGAAARGRFVER